MHDYEKENIEIIIATTVLESYCERNGMQRVIHFKQIEFLSTVVSVSEEIFFFAVRFLQDRVTDHRAAATVIGVERVLSGEYLNDIVEKLVVREEENRVKEFMLNSSSKN